MCMTWTRQDIVCVDSGVDTGVDSGVIELQPDPGCVNGYDGKASLSFDSRFDSGVLPP